MNETTTLTPAQLDTLLELAANDNLYLLLNTPDLGLTGGALRELEDGLAENDAELAEDLLRGAGLDLGAALDQLAR